MVLVMLLTSRSKKGGKCKPFLTGIVPIGIVAVWSFQARPHNGDAVAAEGDAAVTVDDVDLAVIVEE